MDEDTKTPQAQAEQPERRASIGPFVFSKLRKRIFLGIIAFLILVAAYMPLVVYLLLSYTVGAALSNTRFFFSEWNQAGWEPANLGGFVILILSYLLLSSFVAFILSWPANLKRDAGRVRWRDALSLRAVVIAILVIMIAAGYSVWGHISLGNYLEQNKTSDVGKECTDSAQCEGYCSFYEWRYNKRIFPDAPELPKEDEMVTGECSRNKQPICDRPTVPVVEDGLRRNIPCDEFPL